MDNETRRRAEGYAEECDEEERAGFVEWLVEVSEFCEQLCFLTIFDLRDHLWFDAFRSGCTPKSAWNDFVEDGGMEP